MRKRNINMNKILILKVQRKLRSTKLQIPKGFDAKWIAVDPSGVAYVYEAEPIALARGWGSDTGRSLAHRVASFVGYGHDFTEIWKEMKWKIE